jgi:PhoH-like ATPase
MHRPKIILDTSAFIHDPNVYECFPHCDVIIPITVLNELDGLKKKGFDSGKSARVAIRALDALSNLGDIHDGFLIENDIFVRIDVTERRSKDSLLGDAGYGDTQILACALHEFTHHPTLDVTLISQDINLRVKAKARGIQAKEHVRDDMKTPDDLFNGVQNIIDEMAGEELRDKGSISTDFIPELSMHEFVNFTGSDGKLISSGRKISESKIRKVKKFSPWGLSPRNPEQALAIDLLMDRNVDLVTLIGKAGSGKTLITLACCLEMVLNEKAYSKLIIYRPIQEVGTHSIGYLPGSESEKLAPWFSAIDDAMELLLGSKPDSKDKGSNSKTNWKAMLSLYQEKGIIEYSAITYVRGRSLPKALILLDEGQNVTQQDMKTLLTRAGEGSKFIITGDIEQVDNVKMDATDNGLTFVINKFKDSYLSGHVTLQQGERSRLATEAATIL